MIRKADRTDLPAVRALYEAVLDAEAAAGLGYLAWRKGIYPTEETARRGLEEGTLYVGESSGRIWGAVIINNHQAREYEDGAWTLPAEPEEVGVLHTLCVHPEARGQGHAAELVRYGENLCRTQGRRVMRLDTRAVNVPGLKLYASLGYREAGQVELCLQNCAPDRVQLYEKAL